MIHDLNGQAQMNGKALRVRVGSAPEWADFMLSDVAAACTRWLKKRGLHYDTYSSAARARWYRRGAARGAQSLREIVEESMR